MNLKENKVKVVILCLGMVVQILLMSSRAECAPLVYLRGVPYTVVEKDGFDNVAHEFTAQIVVSNVNAIDGMDLTMAYDAYVLEAMDIDGTAPMDVSLVPGIFNQVAMNSIMDPNELIGQMTFEPGDDPNEIRVAGIIRISASKADGVTNVSGEAVIGSVKFRVRAAGSGAIRCIDTTGGGGATISHVSGGKIVVENAECAVTVVNAYDEETPDVDPPLINIFTPEPAAFNPAKGSKTTLKFLLSEPGTLESKIVNAEGNKVWATTPASKKYGVSSVGIVNKIEWNGASNSGELLPTGEYYLEIKATDAAGNVSITRSKTPVKIDTEKPQIIVDEAGIKNRKFSNAMGKQLMFSFKVSENSKGGVYVKDGVNNNKKALYVGDFAKDENVSLKWDGTDTGGGLVPAGTYKIQIIARDEAENEGVEFIREIMIDPTPPTIGGKSPTGETENGMPVIWVSVADPAPSAGFDAKQAVLSIDGEGYINAGKYENGKVWFYPYNQLGIGEHTARVVCADLAGNSSEAEWTFQVVEPLEARIVSVTPEVFNPVNGPTTVKVSSNRQVEVYADVYSGTTQVARTEWRSISAGGVVDIIWDGMWAAGKGGGYHDGIHRIKIYIYNIGRTTVLTELQTTVHVDITAPSINVVEIYPINEKIAPGSDIHPSSYRIKMEMTDNKALTSNLRAEVLTDDGISMKHLYNNLRIDNNTEFELVWNGKDNTERYAASGVYGVEITVTDETGNETKTSRNVTVDRSGPIVKLISPTPGEDTGSATFNAIVKIGDNYGGIGLDDGSFKAYLGETQIDPAVLSWDAGGGMLTFPVSIAGNSTMLKVETADLFGNAGRGMWMFAVDMSPIKNVVITYPGGGAAVKGVVGVNAFADDKGVSSAELRVNDIVVETKYNTQSPTFSWNTAAVDEFGAAVFPDGEYQLKVVARDMGGDEAESAAVSVTVDNTAPVLTAILRSGEGAMEGVLSNAPDAEVLEVRFTPEIAEANGYEWTIECGRGSYGQESWVQAFSGTESVAKGAEPEGIVWDGKMADGTAVEDGEYVCFGRALDDAVNASNYLPTMATVETSAPALSVLSPEDGTAHAGQITMRVSASDVFPGVGKVECVLRRTGMDDEQIVEMTAGVEAGEYEYLWTTNEGDDGIWDVVFRASDLAGNAAESQPITITAANAPVAATNATATPSPFSPNGDGVKDSATINFKLTSAVVADIEWSVDITREVEGVEEIVKSYPAAVALGARTVSCGPIVWTGDIDGSAGTAEDGVYRVVARASAFSSYPDGLLSSGEYTVAEVRIDTAAPQFQLAGTEPEDYFSPNGPGAFKQVAIKAETGEQEWFEAGIKIYCASGNLECVALFGAEPLNSQKRTYTPVGGTTEIVFVWNGSAQTSAAPDGDYRYEISLEDRAGNISTATGTATKDDPPVISVAEFGGAFSKTAEPYAASIEWSADQEGVFSFDLFDETKGQLLENLANGVYHQAGTHTFQWDGGQHEDGTYYIRISGRDMKVAPQRENACAPKWTKAAIDSTPPVVEAFFPLNDEFTELDPRIKLNIYDAWSGFDAENAAESVEIMIDGVAVGNVAIEPIESDKPNAFRAWADVNPALTTEGPRELTATIRDRAGNVAQLPAVRFMAIKPLEDDFSAADIEKRWKAFSNQPQATNASMSVDGGRGLFKVNYHQSHTGGGIEGGAIIRSFGDVTRKRMVVEAKGMDISCDGPQRCGGGIYIGGIKTGDNGEVISGAPSYHVMLMASFTVWDAYGQSSPKLTFGYGAYGDDLGTSPRLSSFYDVAPQLLDVRIVYEEGALSYYFKPTSAPEESYILMGADKANISYIWTAVIGIGISSAQTGDSITVSFDEFTTDIAQPVIHSMTSKNVTTQTQAMTTIEYGEEQFEIVVEGTPWQKDVKARFDNAANPKFNIFSGKSGGGETAYGPYVLVETEPGMYTTGPITADRTKDADGIDARYLIPVANTNLSRVSGVENINITFGYDIYVEEMLRMVQEGTMTQEEMQQIMMSNMLMLITNAVQSVEFTNLDGPPMYEYIKPGERYKVVAATKPGNWDINVVLLNLATFQQRGFDDIEAAIVAGPMKLTKVIEGKYEIIGALGSITDGSGAVADLIIPLLYFGPVESPEYKFGNQLIIGEPIIREALVKNMARPGAEDVVEGETVKITAIANTGQSLMAALFNTGNPDPNALALVGVPIVMEEVSPRQYEAVLELKMLKDWTGTTVTGIMGVAVTPPIQPPDEEPDFAALSYNQLVALEGDRIAPDRPEKPVTISDVEKTPDIGETVTSRFTWTPSSKNEDGSEITDLAGFNIFRVRTIQAQGSFSVAAGSDQMQLSGSEGHYNLSNSALEYQGNIYVGSQINSGAAGWLKKVTTDLTPLPLIDSDFIEPGKHVLACVVNLDLTGMIYGKGAYSGTIYTQDSREAVARWIEKLIDTGIAELGSGIDACTLAFTPNPDGTFTPATQLTALDYYSYESVGEAAAGETVSTDIYAYEHSVYPHAVNAIDMSGNESLPSVITSVPISSEIMADARLLNGPDSVPTGYIQAGESYRLIGNMNVDNGTQAELYLLNLDALENGSTFAQAVIEGPITLDIQGDQFDLTKPLATLEDAAGRTASRLRAVLLLKNHSEEIVTAEGLLKGGVAPVRMVSMSNADRPEKTEIRTGENVLVTAEGNPGLTLIAQLVNPDSVVESIGVAINQDDVQMNEIPSGSGHYEVTARLITNQDKLGASAQRLAAVVSDISGTVNPPVPSSESLNLLVPPSLTGTLAIHPELIRTGWSFESTYTLTNNSQESLSPVTISGSVATPDGQYTYTAASEENLTGGSTIDGTFLHSAVYLSPAVYDVSLWIDINGYQSQVTTTPITIVGDILDGSIVLDRPVYISSETVSVNYSLTNVSGLTSTSANTELRLLDATGTVVQSIPGPTLSELPNNESATGSLSIATPSGLSETERYSLELAAVLDGGEDTIAVASFSVTPEQMLITGFPQPDLIIPNQEPIFEYQLTNNTTSGITNGIITGIIVSPDYVPGNPIFASFEDTVLSLESRDSTHKSATFTPVQATTGEYKILIGFQPSEGSPSETIFETPIWVGSCD